MSSMYYIFLVLIVVAFLACVVITVFDNTKGQKKEKRFDTKYKSRRSLYNDFVNKMPSNNFYSYSNLSKQINSSSDMSYTTEVNIQISEPKITSVEEVRSTPFIKSVVTIDE